MIEIDEQINAVRRTVGTRVLEAGEARVITVSQAYDTPLADLWDACTSAERISRWFLPVSGDLRVGGHYSLEGNASGTVERCDPPRSFAATWEMGDQVSWIEVRLTEEGEGRARFELEHVAHVDDKLWPEFGPGAVGIGWDMAVLGLALHLSSGVSMDPAEGAAWAASDEGRRFMTLSSDKWAEASIAAGTDPAEARAAAQRVLAAYTAFPEPPPAS
ncbi:SRPBCC family protein [Microbispora sp. RL4-1S]|uniref:SRPBCC family protein n=1 Tax=Microbispora oryzae TaxID=2806554 RepID=A0A940WLS2_9ACTN|nr:SRPBCC family protein [Microbispora oryzae]MBP2707975.1 SRPBCC family protein [Microbispora oryzae]